MSKPKFTQGPWEYGGPVKRESLLRELTAGIGPNGLSEEVYEIGMAGESFPPGICVVNDHYDANTDTRTPAEDNARLIAQAPAMYEWMDKTRQLIPELKISANVAINRLDEIKDWMANLETILTAIREGE